MYSERQILSWVEQENANSAAAVKHSGFSAESYSVVLAKSAPRTVRLADSFPCFSLASWGFTLDVSWLLLHCFPIWFLQLSTLPYQFSIPNLPEQRAVFLSFSETSCSVPGKCCGQNPGMITGSHFPFVCLLGSQLHTALGQHWKQFLLKLPPLHMFPFLLFVYTQWWGWHLDLLLFSNGL